FSYNRTMSGRRNAFTLIEIIIVIAISAVLATIAIGYNRGVQNEVALSVETAKVSQTIITAKSLALTTYTSVGASAGAICGYGVFFDVAANTYSIFEYVPSASTLCPTLASTTANGVAESGMNPYSSATWRVPLANGVKLVTSGSGNDLSAVLFLPPAPTTLLSTSASDPHAFGAGGGT